VRGGTSEQDLLSAETRGASREAGCCCPHLDHCWDGGTWAFNSTYNGVCPGIAGTEKRIGPTGFGNANAEVRNAEPQIRNAASGIRIAGADFGNAKAEF